MATATILASITGSKAGIVNQSDVITGIPFYRIGQDEFTPHTPITTKDNNILKVVIPFTATTKLCPLDHVLTVTADKPIALVEIDDGEGWSLVLSGLGNNPATWVFRRTIPNPESITYTINVTHSDGTLDSTTAVLAGSRVAYWKVHALQIQVGQGSTSHLIVDSTYSVAEEDLAGGKTVAVLAPFNVTMYARTRLFGFGTYGYDLGRTLWSTWSSA